jgi:type IV secretion system protein VirB10
MDGGSNGELDRAEGKVKSEGNKAGDARTVGEATVAGGSVGMIAGNAAGHLGMGAGIGAAAGAAAGMAGVLLTRGPDAVLAKGSTIEMLLDRSLSFSEGELDFGNYHAPRASASTGPEAGKAKSGSSVPIPRRFPE